MRNTVQQAYGISLKSVWQLYGNYSKSDITKNQLALPVLALYASRFPYPVFFLIHFASAKTKDFKGASLNKSHLCTQMRILRKKFPAGISYQQKLYKGEYLPSYLTFKFKEIIISLQIKSGEPYHKWKSKKR